MKKSEAEIVRIFLQKAGKKGGLKVRDTRPPDHFSKLGKLSGAARRRKKLAISA